MTGDLYFSQAGQSLPAAVQWLLDLLLGPLGTSIAIIAVAFLGYQMMTGRISAGRALRVLLGCFVLFGSPVIVGGLMGVGGQYRESALLPVVFEQPSSPPLPDARPGPISNPFDPYANNRSREQSSGGTP